MKSQIFEITVRCWYRVWYITYLLYVQRQGIVGRRYLVTGVESWSVVACRLLWPISAGLRASWHKWSQLLGQAAACRPPAHTQSKCFFVYLINQRGCIYPPKCPRKFIWRHVAHSRSSGASYAARRSTVGDRAGAVTGPHATNNLPVDLHLSQTFSTFKTHVKSHLFNISFRSVWLYHWLYFVHSPWSHLCCIRLSKLAIST